MLLAEDDADAVVRACQVAAQGQNWQPNMFIYTLQKRHSDNEIICDIVTQLLKSFSERMPITSPIHLDNPRSLFKSKEGAGQEEHFVFSDEDVMRGYSGSSPHRRTQTLPSLGSPKATSQSPTHALHSPTTTMSSLYMEESSPYAPHMRLPITRPITSPLEQSRRSKIFSTPKLAAVDGDKQRRCRTPNARELSRPNHFQLAAFDAETNEGVDSQAHKFRSLDPLDVSPPRSPESESPKKRVALSNKYSWNPECINSVSGFEWWWRSLPQNHSNLEPTQKLKMVTKAAVRLHTKNDWQRAIELYQLSLSMEINAEVEFRLRINLACAYEAAQELQSSIQAFRAALELNPEDPYARFKLGEVLGATGEFMEARALFESVLSAYPQAADALKKLQRTETLQMEEEEAKQAATAAAKLRRSPLKKKRWQHESEHEEKKLAVASNSTVQPMAPSSPATSSPASRRASGKLKKSAEQASPRVESSPVECTESNELTVANESEAISEPMSRQAPLASLDLHTTVEDDTLIDSACSAAESTHGSGHLNLQDLPVAHSHVSVASVGIMAQVSTTSVGIVTDVCEPQTRVLDLLVERCTDLDINLRKYLLQFDSCQEGLVRLESLAELIRILCNTAFSALSDSALVTEVQQAFPNNAWVRHGQHTFVRHESVLAACEANKCRGGIGVREVESGTVHRQLQELAEREGLFLIRYLAETSTDRWMREGAQRAAGNAGEARVRESSAAADDITADETLTMPNMSKGPRSADVEDQGVCIPQDLLQPDTCAQIHQEHADGVTTDDGEENDPLMLSEEGDKYAMTDGYTTLSPRMNVKREKARQEQILRREKSRVFARKHIHCLRTLRELAVHARKHHTARCEAREFLAQIVNDARGKLTVQAKMDGEPQLVVSESTNHVEDLQQPAPGSGAQPVQRARDTINVSHQVYADAVDAVIRKIIAASGLTVSQLQSLARSFAAFSQVPPLLQDCYAPVTVSPSDAECARSS